MSVHRPSADERLVTKNRLVRIHVIALGDAVREFIRNDPRNRDSEQPRRYEHRYKK